MAITIPTISECINHMDEFVMWENIRRHSFMVARVADILLKGLHDSKNSSTAVLIDRDLVIAGALMHDIAKRKCLQEHCRHADVGRDICINLGYPEIAYIVANHVVLSNFKREDYRLGIFRAVELVYYADKRVKHDQVVSLDERLEYIIDKYSNNESIREDSIRQNFTQCQELETLLFNRLPFLPEDIPVMLASSSEELLYYPPEPANCS